jgi:hypothetical protein
LVDYKDLIQGDLNGAAHDMGYHIIITCEFTDLNPFNMGNYSSHRHYYHIERIVDLTLVDDKNLCEVMSI